MQKFYAESSSGRIDISDHFGVSACFTADPMLDLQFWNEKSNKPEDGEGSLIALQNTNEVLVTAMIHVQQRWFEEKRIVGLSVVAFFVWQVLAALYWSYGKWDSDSPWLGPFFCLLTDFVYYNSFFFFFRSSSSFPGIFYVQCQYVV